MPAVISWEIGQDLTSSILPELLMPVELRFSALVGRQRSISPPPVCCSYLAIFLTMFRTIGRGRCCSLKALALATPAGD